MVEFVKKPLELKIYGKEVVLHYPTFGKSKAVQKQLKERPDDAGDIASQFLVECGMPADLLDELEMQHLTQIQEMLLSPKKN